ncbi:MAG: thioredoxin-like domain-containing protein, partial [Bacteroidota bacterium]|nr:thioredoxin-like domain-containing protein [Bacteroidota bacterium]
MKKISAIICLVVLIGTVAFSQDIRATTDEGRSVVLKKSGVWFFTDRTALQNGRAVIYDGRAVKLEKNGKWSFLNNKTPLPVPAHKFSSSGSRGSSSSYGDKFSGMNLHSFLSQSAKEIATSNGVAVDQSRFTTKKYVLVYFSAHWCGPCRAFTPDLVKFYNENGGGDKFEILFVSSDYDAQSMMTYMNAMSMPWIGVRWKSEGAQAISHKYAGSGIPCLVLLNGNDEVLSHSYVG